MKGLRYAILSDIHGNLEALEAVIKDIRAQKVEKIICLGDIVGYYPDPNPCIELVRSLATLSLRGNHDRASVGLLDPAEFNPAARAALEWTKKELHPKNRAWLATLPDEKEVDGLFLAVHGAPGDPDAYIFSAADAGYALRFLAENFPHLRFCFFGHTHQKALWSTKEAEPQVQGERRVFLGDKGRYLLNPGSVGQPRDGEIGASYLLFSPAEGTVEWRQVAYDFHRTQKKVLAAGLPPFLAERLSHGF